MQDGLTMSPEVEFFGSLQSPYCYFALDRLKVMMRDLQVQIVMRPVLPGVIRIPDTYAERSAMEQAYFLRDVARTAEFLGLPYHEPDPSPVNWAEGSLWIAKADQQRVVRLYNLLYEAHLRGEAFPLYVALMRLIWSGQTPGWDAATHLRKCVAACGLSEHLIDQPDELTIDAECYFAANQQAMLDYGHWGVPMFSWRREPFYGQDRLDQLRWRIERS
jgi:2-hydroxychromene-2-carboxylate isomerase